MSSRMWPAVCVYQGSTVFPYLSTRRYILLWPPTQYVSVQPLTLVCPVFHECSTLRMLGAHVLSVCLGCDCDGLHGSEFLFSIGALYLNLPASILFCIFLCTLVPCLSDDKLLSDRTYCWFFSRSLSKLSTRQLVSWRQLFPFSRPTNWIDLSCVLAFLSLFVFCRIMIILSTHPLPCNNKACPYVCEFPPSTLNPMCINPLESGRLRKAAVIEAVVFGVTAA